MCKPCANRLKNNSRMKPNREHALYTVWYSMKQRCLNSNSLAYPNYGGRGITVCPEWMGFDLFYEWATSNGYQQGLEIDRADNDKGYTPDNCRFVTPTVNANNKRSTVKVTAFGETKSVYEWVNDPRCAVKPKLLQERVRLGWDGEKAVSTPSMGQAGIKVRP